MKLKDPKREARALLSEHAITTPPVPVERIIKARRIVLQYAALDEDLSGMAFIKDGVPMIGINALHHPNRQRFSAAHELGHHILHIEEISRAVHVDKGMRVLFRNDASTLGTERMEIDANAFAAELLMPAPLVADALENKSLDLDDEKRIEDLARRFRVSVAAIRYRLTQTDR